MLTTLDWILIFNSIAALILVFFEEKRPRKAVAWLLIMILLPVAGIILFIIFGQNFRKKKQAARKSARDRMYVHDLIDAHRIDYLTATSSLEEVGMRSHDDMVNLLVNNSDAFLTHDNDVTFFSDGKEYFNALFAAIEGAREHVHVQYYIIRHDRLGCSVLDLLKRKSREGVEVRLLVDGVGTRLPMRCISSLREAGVKVEVFFPPLLSFLPFLNHRINFRNHRKITVIDGRISFIGGYNVGNEYLGKVRRWGYWRDAALRIDGMAAQALQLRFLLHSNEASRDKMDVEERYFPKDVPRRGRVPVQIVSSGPDTPWSPIKLSYLKMIHEAEESIYIQSPYFVPDESVREALIMASLSGIDVRIMIPDKPDHPFVHWVSLSYLCELLPAGVRGYLYGSGFIHAKTVVVDGRIASIGSANWDVRSFELNFETNAVLYSNEVAGMQKASFLDDLSLCRELTKEDCDRRPLLVRFRMFVSRLFSDIL